VEDVKRRLTLATADVEMWKDRAAWTERMVMKGFMTDRQLQQERAQLQAAELALEALKKELDTLPKESK
jgi:outer membrane protein TolC